MKLFFVIYCPLGCGAGILLYLWGDANQFNSALWGSSVSICLAWLTIFSTNRLFESRDAGLLILVFGGMGVRFFVILIIGILVHLFTDLLIVSFFAGLLYSYFILQVVEIIYIYKRFVKR